MKFDPPLIRATILRRYKRFLADVELPGGERITVHCPNTGSMKNCLVEGSLCWLIKSDNVKRKYAYSWELATTPTGHLAGINTLRANMLVVEAIQNQTIKELQGYDTLLKEQKYGSENSRIDILLRSQVNPKLPACFIEVKSVTLGVGRGLGLFPDAISVRASKHLRELMGVVATGGRAVLVFCVQHSGIERVRPADTIDPAYGNALRQAASCGVELLAYKAEINPLAMALKFEIPIELGDEGA
ncbi:MAG: sugar fermentation stimulation protein A [Lentisphaeria bacterium]|jgi:sugar fermentation stimulation protein A